MSTKLTLAKTNQKENLKKMIVRRIVKNLTIASVESVDEATSHRSAQLLERSATNVSRRTTSGNSARALCMVWRNRLQSSPTELECTISDMMLRSRQAAPELLQAVEVSTMSAVPVLLQVEELHRDTRSDPHVLRHHGSHTGKVGDRESRPQGWN